MAAFTDFGELRDRILSDTAKPANSSFDREIPGFVALAEARMWYGSGAYGSPLYCEPLRVRAMETSTSSLAFTDGVGSLSGLTGFLDKRNLYWPTTPISEPLYEPPAIFWSQKDNTSTDSTTEAIGYTIEGNAIYLRPLLTGNATFLYYAKITSLTANDSVNWILTNAPGAYLHGILIEAYRWLRNAEKRADEFMAYQAVIAALNGTEARARFSGGRLLRRATW